MTVTVITPKENFPEIGPVRNPSMLYDGSDLFLCYEVASVDGGNAVIRFGDVIDFRTSPMNVDELPKCRYPANYYAFNEILNAEETLRWKALEARLWIISFHDVTVEVLFDTAELLFRTHDDVDPSITLLKFLNDHK